MGFSLLICCTGFLITSFWRRTTRRKRVMVIGYAAALPGLLVAMFLFPAYHGFPPYPLHRPFWSQAGDHYFFATYSFLVMGAATVYEWDLLFPDLLDIFVLSVLPIAKERLFFGRVFALGIFLALVLGGTSVLGTIFFPLVAEQHNIFRHLLAHITAVTMSGMFAAASFLALQGVLLNTVGEGTFRRMTPLLQGASIMALLAILLLNPTISASLQALLNSGSPAVRYFPPFWFLGVYERIMDGPSAPQIFHSLAWTGCYAVLFVIAATLVTYPLAYRRRVRQLIEGARAVDSSRARAILRSAVCAHDGRAAATAASGFSLHQPDDSSLSAAASDAGAIRRTLSCAHACRDGCPAHYNGAYPAWDFAVWRWVRSADSGFLDGCGPSVCALCAR